LAEAVITGVDLSQGAADDAWMGFELACLLVQGVELVLADAPERVGGLGQVAVGVVLVGGDSRCREGGIDCFCLAQCDGAGGCCAGAGAEPALEGGAGCGWEAGVRSFFVHFPK